MTDTVERVAPQKFTSKIKRYIDELRTLAGGSHMMPTSVIFAKTEPIMVLLDHYAAMPAPRVSVAEAARVLLEHGAHPEQYAIYGNDRTDRYAKGFCGGVEATIERLRALSEEAQEGEK